jgi:hypothetical protein
MEYAAPATCGQRVADACSNLAIVDPDFDHVTDQGEFGEIGQHRSLSLT